MDFATLLRFCDNIAYKGGAGRADAVTASALVVLLRDADVLPGGGMEHRALAELRAAGESGYASSP